MEVVDHRVDALRGGIKQGPSGERRGEGMPEEMHRGGPVERSFKDKGTVKVQPFL